MRILGFSIDTTSLNETMLIKVMAERYEGIFNYNNDASSTCTVQFRTAIAASRFMSELALLQAKTV